MTTYVVSSSPIFGLPNGFINEVADDIEKTALSLLDYSGVDVAIAGDDDLAIELALPIYLDGKVISTDCTNFISNHIDPSWLKTHEKRVISSVTITNPGVKRIVLDSLSELTPEKILSHKRALFIFQTDLGSGKSKLGEAVARLAISRGIRTAVYAPLISIVDGVELRFKNAGLDPLYYNKIESPEHVDRSDVCLSTYKSNYKTGVSRFSGKAGVAILEEGKKGVDSACCEDNVRHREKILDAFFAVCGETDIPIICDRDVNDTFIEKLSQYRPIDEIVVVTLSKPTPKKKVTFTEDFGQTIENMLADLKAGKNIAVGSDRKDFAEAISKIISEAGYKSSLLIHAENKGLAEQKKFLMSPDDHVEKFSSIVYSPAMGSSVSIEKPHVNKIYFMAGGVLTPSAGIQMMERFRDGYEIEVCFNLPEKRGWWSNISTVDTTNEFINKVLAETRYLAETVITGLPILMKHYGYKCFVAEYDEIAEEGRHKFYSALSRVRGEYRRGVRGANKITPEEASDRISRDDLTAEEVHERDAALVRKLLGVSKIEHQDILYFSNGAGEKYAQRMDAIEMSEEACKRKDKDERGSPDRDRKRWLMTHRWLGLVYNELKDGFDSAVAVSTLAKLNRTTAWNSLKICNYSPKKIHDRGYAITKCRAILRELGIRTRENKKRGVIEVTNLDRIAMYRRHRHIQYPQLARMAREQAKCKAIKRQLQDIDSLMGTSEEALAA